MGDNKINMPDANTGGTARKRGHQHHIRNTGTRRSNVPADEVIAALRSGSDLLMSRTYHDVDDDDDQSKRQSFTDDDDVIMLDIDNNRTNSNLNSISTDNNANARLVLSENTSNNRNDDLRTKVLRKPRVVSGNSDAGTSQLNSTTAGDCLPSIDTSSAFNDKNNNNLVTNSSREHTMLEQVGLGDSVSSGSSSTNAPSNSSSSRIVKSKKTKKSSKSSSNDAKPKKDKRNKKVLPPKEERPPLEGAAANELVEPDVGDIENDPEAAEWSKLRCTSERTEVVAEREYRRQNRRCADYPGLAFGRSIFSSDTMMKFNIIRNELHNIMKTQLKRVGWMRKKEQ